MNEETRKSNNAARLAFVDASIRPQVSLVLAELERAGFRPVIAKEVWRAPELQMRLYREGRSQVRWGFHCATDKQGQPASLAADIIDADKAWNVSRAFWLALGRAAHKLGLGWGGFFGLGEGQKRLLRAALESADPRDEEKLALGWDVAHVETRRVSVAEARAGRR